MDKLSRNLGTAPLEQHRRARAVYGTVERLLHHVAPGEERARLDEALTVLHARLTEPAAAP